MKLASLKNGTRDGRLVVVSKDLTRCTDAARIAPTLQAALDMWDMAAPKLAALAEQVELGSVPTFRFMSMNAKAHCRARISGLMVRRTSIMSSWFAKPAAQRFRQASTKIR